jgi:hypothetical protein
MKTTCLADCRGKAYAHPHQKRPTYCTEDTGTFYLSGPFDESFARRSIFRMRRTLAIGAGIRTAVALAAVYAMLFNALLAAAAPHVAAPSADLIICTHDSGGSDQPSAPSSTAHDNLCCITVCGVGAAALVPSDFFQIALSPRSILLPPSWSRALVAPKPPPNLQGSPRGPPSLV